MHTQVLGKQKDTIMDTLLATPDQPQLPKVGDTVEGKVISVSKNEVFIDIQGVLMGIVRGKEIFDESEGTGELQVGNVAQATVLDLENEKGMLELSFRQAGHQKAWGELEHLMHDGSIIDVPVTDANKGGLMVRVGRIEGFLPVSQLTVEHYPRVEGGDKNRILELLMKFTGNIMRVKVIDINENDSKLIVSE
ncbi:MAG: S1 RNA-binding domain-containing protein, partial [Parcubacteria group bacterium]